MPLNGQRLPPQHVPLVTMGFPVLVAALTRVYASAAHSEDPIEQTIDNGCYGPAMADVYRPANWPEAVDPPGAEDWEASAVSWLLDLVPELRGQATVRRHPVAVAAIARHILTGSLDGARQGYRTARTELGEAVPPHVVDAVLAAYKSEGRRLAEALRSMEPVERALSGEPL